VRVTVMSKAEGSYWHMCDVRSKAVISEFSLRYVLYYGSALNYIIVLWKEGRFDSWNFERTMNKEINISDGENFNLYYIGFVREEITHKIVVVKPKPYITMAIMDVTHRPALYLKLNSNL
jgi:hypothetical protein